MFRARAFQKKHQRFETVPRDDRSSKNQPINTTCRKRNLRRRSCYEFRVRAASVSGWSPHSDPLVITTLAEAPGDAAPARPATSQAPSRGNGAQRDRRSAGELPAVGRRAEIFNPTSMCAYATVSTQALRLCFEHSTRAIDSSKN